MKRFLSGVIVTACSVILGMNVAAAEDKRQSGAETSAEHKSEQGLEHGEAYAGSKEKKVKEEKIRNEKEEKVKKEKSDKEEKMEKEKTEKEDKVKKEKKEK